MFSVRCFKAVLNNVRLINTNKYIYQTYIKATIPVTNNVYDKSFHTSLVKEGSRSKDKGKDNKKKTGKVEVRLNEMSQLIDTEQLQNQCNNIIEKFKEDLVKFVSLRSSVGSIETVKVHFEGKDYELQQLAQISRKNPKTVILNMVSFPQAIPAALKALEASGLNLNPQQESTTVYIPIPTVTKEHREQLAKNTKVLHLKCKTALKQLELDYMKKAKSNSNVSSDIISNVQRQITALVDGFGKQAKDIMNLKYLELGAKST